MSLQLDGILKPVELADEGTYIDNGVTRYIGRSGRLCKGLRFELILGCLNGALMSMRSSKFGVLAYQDDELDDPLALTYDGIINFASLVASKIAQFSHGVIFGLKADIGIYRPDELYSSLPNDLNTAVLDLNVESYRRVVNTVAVDVTPTVKSDFRFVIPFLGNVESLLSNINMSLDDSMNFVSSVSDVPVHYGLGYLKFVDINQTRLVGVLTNNIYRSKIVRSNNQFPIRFQNNDVSAGVYVRGSHDYSSSDTVISEKY